MSEEEKNEATGPEAEEAAAPETEEAKPARKPRARKPKAAAAEATTEAKAEEPEAEESVAETADDVAAEEATDEVVEAEDEVIAATAASPEVEKPKRSRAAKPKAEAVKVESKSRQPEPKGKPGRRGHEQPVAAPVVRAQAKYVRSSARKARLVCDNIRGKSVEDARAILAHTPRAVARDWSKLLESAVANAEHNHELVGEDLFIKAVTADEGPTIKRFRPRAMGRATKIRKRTAHLTILLTPKN
jgi:ribosomal protein L22